MLTDAALAIAAEIEHEWPQIVDHVRSAMATVIAAEIEYAQGEIAPGSTLTRVPASYDGADATVTVFITTTIKACDGE